MAISLVLELLMAAVLLDGPGAKRKYDRTADNKHVRHTREVAQPRRGLCDANGDPPSGCLSLLPHSKCAPVTVLYLLLQFCNRAAFPRG